MFTRSEEDIAAGVIRLPLGGQVYILPTLPWEASEEWQAGLQARITELAGRQADDLDQMVDILKGAMSVLVDLIAAYDREHRLGRDAADLRSRYDRAQIYEVFKAIGRHEFPFLNDAESMTTMVLPYLRPILAALAARQAPPNTSNGHSPTGDLTPVPSVDDLMPSSSGSSGEQVRSG